MLDFYFLISIAAPPDDRQFIDEAQATRHDMLRESRNPQLATGTSTQFVPVEEREQLMRAPLIKPKKSRSLGTGDYSHLKQFVVGTDIDGHAMVNCF